MVLFDSSGELTSAACTKLQKPLKFHSMTSFFHGSGTGGDSLISTNTMGMQLMSFITVLLVTTSLLVNSSGLFIMLIPFSPWTI